MAVGALLTVIAAGLSGCGGHADGDKGDAKKPAATAPSFAKASTAFADTVDGIDCQTMEPDSCWDEMQKLIKSARTLRHSMNGEKSVSADFWTGAYQIIDTMEDAMSEGSDLGGAQEGESIDHSVIRSNRDEVFGGAHDLADWLDEHPIK